MYGLRGDNMFSYDSKGRIPFIVFVLLSFLFLFTEKSFSADLGTYSLDCDSGLKRYPFHYYSELDSTYIFQSFNDKNFLESDQESDVMSYLESIQNSDYENFYSTATSTTTGHVFSNVIRTTTYSPSYVVLVGPSSLDGYVYWDGFSKKYYSWTGCYTDMNCSSEQVYDFDQESCVLTCPEGFVVSTDFDTGVQTCVQDCGDNKIYDEDFDMCIFEGSQTTCEPSDCENLTNPDDLSNPIYNCSYFFNSEYGQDSVYKETSSPCGLIGDFDDVNCDPKIDWKCDQDSNDCGIGYYFSEIVRECLLEDSTYLCIGESCEQISDDTFSCEYVVVPTDYPEDLPHVDPDLDHVILTSHEKCGVSHVSPDDNNVSDISDNENCGIGEIYSERFKTCVLEDGVYKCQPDTCRLEDGTGTRCDYDVYQDNIYVNTVSYVQSGNLQDCVLDGDSNSFDDNLTKEISFDTGFDLGVDLLESKMDGLDIYLQKVFDIKDKIDEILHINEFSTVSFPTLSVHLYDRDIVFFSEEKYQKVVPTGFDNFLKQSFLFLMFFNSILVLLRGI